MAQLFALEKVWAYELYKHCFCQPGLKKKEPPTFGNLKSIREWVTRCKYAIDIVKKIAIKKCNKVMFVASEQMYLAEMRQKQQFQWISAVPI